MTEEQEKRELGTEIVNLLENIKKTVRNPEDHTSLLTHLDSLIQEFTEVRPDFESLAELQEHRTYYQGLLATVSQDNLDNNKRAKLIAGG